VEEFGGRRRIFVVWVKRLGLGSADWSPIACLTRKEAAGEIRKARSSGDMAFVAAYQKAKRTSKDVATEELGDLEAGGSAPGGSAPGV
jgi:hypothetical protein